MDSGYISCTVAHLRAKLNQIGIENRFYFTKKHHREGEILDHQRRAERGQPFADVLEIQFAHGPNNDLFIYILIIYAESLILFTEFGQGTA